MVKENADLRRVICVRDSGGKFLNYFFIMLSVALTLIIGIQLGLYGPGQRI